MNEYTNENLPPDAELGPVAADLDRLAARERAAASPALESRILMATRAALAPAAAAHIHEPVVAGRITVTHRRVWITRIAAVMALSLCAWGGYLAIRPAATPAITAKNDVDSLLAAMDAVDSLAGTASELQKLAAQAVLIQSTIRGDFAEPLENEQENL